MILKWLRKRTEMKVLFCIYAKHRMRSSFTYMYITQKGYKI